MVLSAYSLSASNSRLISSSVVPSFAVFVSIVWMDLILSSYSVKPVLAPSIVNAFTIRSPVSMALFVMFCSAVTPIIPSTENLSAMVFTELFSVARSVILACLLMAASSEAVFPRFTPGILFSESFIFPKIPVVS